METIPSKVSGMPSAYYRREAERVRELARDATTDAIRKHLAEIADFDPPIGRILRAIGCTVSSDGIVTLANPPAESYHV